MGDSLRFGDQRLACRFGTDLLNLGVRIVLRKSSPYPSHWGIRIEAVMQSIDAHTLLH